MCHFGYDRKSARIFGKVPKQPVNSGDKISSPKTSTAEKFS